MGIGREVNIEVKPKTVRWAIWLVGISFALNALVQGYLVIKMFQERGLFNDDETRALIGAAVFVRFILALFVPLIAVLVFSKRRSWIAFVFLIYCCFHILKFPARVQLEFQTGVFFGAIYLLFVMMQLGGTALLFVKSSRDWLKLN